MKKINLISLTFLFTGFLSAQSIIMPSSPTLNSMAPICAYDQNNSIIYNTSYDVISGESGPDYGCLMATPNPSWYYLKTTDDLSPIQIQLFISPYDLPLIVWGPFQNLSINYNSLQTDKIVDCDQGNTNWMHFEIDTVTPNSYYIVMISSWPNTVSAIYFELLTGSIECPNIMNFTEEHNVSGKVFFDLNTNCNDDSEYPVPNAMVKATPGEYFAITNETGYYSMYLPQGLYNIETVGINGFSDTCNGNTLNVSSSNGTFESNRGLQSTIPTNNVDVAVSLIGQHIFITNGATGPFNLYHIYFTNNNINPSSGYIDLVLDSELQMNWSNESYTNINDSTYRFEYTNLQFNESRAILFKTNDLNALSFQNYIAYSSASIYPNETDVYPQDNQSTYGYLVQLPFDPNNISVYPLGNYEENYIETSDSVFTYIVNFQNTGFAPAINVNIYDSIPLGLDIESFELIASSHNCQVLFNPDNTLRFFFENIMLTDSLHNEPDSHGFVIFRLKTNQALNIGDEIVNFADIYFDNNPPVRTNDVKSIVQSATSINAFSNAQIKIFPNPASENIQIALSNTSSISTIKLFSLNGQLLKSLSVVDQKSVIIPVKNLKKGLYLVKVESEDQAYTSRVIIY